MFVSPSGRLTAKFLRSKMVKNVLSSISALKCQKNHWNDRDGILSEECCGFDSILEQKTATRRAINISTPTSHRRQCFKTPNERVTLPLFPSAAAQHSWKLLLYTSLSYTKFGFALEFAFSYR